MTKPHQFPTGIDVGTRLTRLVVLDGDERTVATAYARTLASPGDVARDLVERTCRDAGLEPHFLQPLVATGFARRSIPGALCVTDATAHAFAAARSVGKDATVAVLGAQHTHGLRISAWGRVQALSRNDRCAAGGGRFLERLARRLGVRMRELDALAGGARRTQPLTSVCSVLAESEVISRLSKGHDCAETIAAAFQAVGVRVAGQLAALGDSRLVVCIGGGARLKSLVAAIGAELGVAPMVPPAPELAGALGAALIAARRISELRWRELAAVDDVHGALSDAVAASTDPAQQLRCQEVGCADDGEHGVGGR